MPFEVVSRLYAGMAEGKLKIGSRVEVTGKDVVGTIAYIGTTQFSPGRFPTLFLF